MAGAAWARGLCSPRTLHSAPLCACWLQNCLLMEAGGSLPIVKLADFGLSTRFRPGELCYDGPVGTPLCMAPEVVASIDGRPYDAMVRQGCMG